MDEEAYNEETREGEMSKEQQVRGQSEQVEQHNNWKADIVVGAIIVLIILAGGLIAASYFGDNAELADQRNISQKVKKDTGEVAQEKDLSKASRKGPEFIEPDPVEGDLTYRVIDTSEDTVDENGFRTNDNPTIITEIKNSNLTKAGPYFFNKEDVYYGEKFTGVSKGVNGSTQEGYNLRLIEQANNSNFRVYKKDTRYARDERNVYFVQTKPFSTIRQLHVMKEAEPETFVPKIATAFDISKGNTIQNWIAKDKPHVFFAGEIIPKADPATFEITERPRINKDKDHVYLLSDNQSYEILQGADPQSFKVLVAEHQGPLYATDKDTFFVNDCPLKTVDVETVEVLDKYPSVFRDKDGRFSVNYEDGSCNIKRQ